jgi:hypothetical protein
MKLDNRRVRVSEIVYQPGEARQPYTRPSDQVIVFLDDAIYERVDPQTGKIEVRQRKSGDVIWHDKGEWAPELRPQRRAYRTLLIEIK